MAQLVQHWQLVPKHHWFESWSDFLDFLENLLRQLLRIWYYYLLLDIIILLVILVATFRIHFDKLINFFFHLSFIQQVFKKMHDRKVSSSNNLMIRIFKMYFQILFLPSKGKKVMNFFKDKILFLICFQIL